jgi:uncharacterized protein YheU (UPF0270 family)
LAQFVAIPLERVPAETLNALLEEYASRDGTDYGERETPLETRVGSLLGDLRCGRLQLLFDLDSEQWDLLPADDARHLLDANPDASRDE